MGVLSCRVAQPATSTATSCRLPRRTRRRDAAFARIDAGELNSAEAATELGLTVGTWSSWRSYHEKRAGRPGGDDTRLSEPDLTKRLVRLEELEQFGVEQKARSKALVRFVEKRAPRKGV